MARQGVYQQKGDIINFTNTGETMIDAGQVVPLVTRIGYAVADIPPGTTGDVLVEGVIADVPADNTAAFAVGDTLYWDDTNYKLTKVATDNIPTGGWCVTAKPQAGTVTAIKLVG